MVLISGAIGKDSSRGRITKSNLVSKLMYSDPWEGSPRNVAGA